MRVCAVDGPDMHSRMNQQVRADGGVHSGSDKPPVRYDDTTDRHRRGVRRTTSCFSRKKSGTACNVARPTASLLPPFSWGKSSDAATPPTDCPVRRRSWGFLIYFLGLRGRRQEIGSCNNERATRDCREMDDARHTVGAGTLVGEGEGELSTATLERWHGMMGS